jgi:hypothetical protein
MASAATAAAEVEAWREELFRCICRDAAAPAERLLRAGCGDSADELVFGVFFSRAIPAKHGHGHGRVSSAAVRRELIAYGAHFQDSRDCVRQGATALHVAVWKNAVKVAQMLLRLGASTGKQDLLGVSAFDRATTHEMETVLRRPVAPRDVQVVACSQGRALVRWTTTRSKPRVELYEVREEVSGVSWVADADADVQVFTTGKGRDAPVHCLFHSPPGSVESSAQRRFSVRSRNVDGFWSEWGAQMEAAQAQHWVEEWAAEHGRAEQVRLQAALADKAKAAAGDSLQASAPLYPDEPRRLHLVLGSRSFGFVRAEDFIRRAQGEQAKAAARVQAVARAWVQRRHYAERKLLGERLRTRKKAAGVIQRFYRRHVSAGSDARHEAHSADTRASYKGIMKERDAAQRRRGQKQLSGLMREKARYKAMQACGYTFQGELPKSWK